MEDSSTLTKAALQAALDALWLKMEARLETGAKAVAEFREEFTLFRADAKRDSLFVAEKFTEVLDRLDGVEARLDGIQKRLDGQHRSLLTDVHAFVGEDHVMLRNHSRRIDRLELKVGIRD